MIALLAISATASKKPRPDGRGFALHVIDVLMRGADRGRLPTVQQQSPVRTCRTIVARAKLCFTHFKRRRRGNPQAGGTGRLGVPAYRGWLRTVKNLRTPATGGAAPGRWRPRRWATACRTRPPGVGSWGAVFATRGRPRWSRRRAPAGRGWCGRWPGRTTGVGSPRPSGSAPPER